MDIIENSEVIMKMPPWSIGKVLIYGFTGVSLVLFIVATAMSPKPSNSNFMFFELLSLRVSCFHAVGRIWDPNLSACESRRAFCFA